MTLASEKVVVQAPLSYTGSAKRLWKFTRLTSNAWVRFGLLALPAIIVIAAAWMVVTGWYVFFGLLLVPYRLIRRGSRKQKRQALQHRELLDAIAKATPGDTPTVQP